MSKDPFKYTVEVKGIKELANAVTKAESYYISMSKSLDRVSSVVSKNSESWISANSAANKATKDTADVEEKSEQVSTRAFKSKSGFMSNISKHLSTAKMGWLSILGVFSGVVAFLVSAVKKFIDFDNLFRKLNVVLYGNQQAISGVTSAATSLAAAYGMTYEEGMLIGKLGGELALFEKGIKNLSKHTHEWVVEVATLSKATDTSVQSISSMFYNMTRLYGLPHGRLKNIAAAFSVIQQKTSASGEELSGYAQSLTGLFMRLPNLSKQAREQLVVDTMAIGAAIKQAGGTPEEFISTFKKMATEGSQEGQKAIAEVARLSGKSQEYIKNLVDKGEMNTIFKQLGTGLGRFTNRQLELDKNYISEYSGMAFETIMATRKVMEDGGEKYLKLQNDIIKAQDKANIQKRIAASLFNFWTKLMFQVKEAWSSLNRQIGKLVLTLATKLIKWIIPKFVEFVLWLDTKIKWLNGPAGDEWLKKWNDWLDDNIIPNLKLVWGYMKSFMEGLDSWLSGKSKMPTWLETTISIVKVLAITTKAAFTPIKLMLEGIGNIIKWIKEGLGVIGKSETFKKLVDIYKGGLSPERSFFERQKSEKEYEKLTGKKFSPYVEKPSFIVSNTSASTTPNTNVLGSPYASLSTEEKVASVLLETFKKAPAIVSKFSPTTYINPIQAITEKPSVEESSKYLGEIRNDIKEMVRILKVNSRRSPILGNNRPMPESIE